MTASSNNATEFLTQLSGGESAAADRLMPLVYDELRALAARHLQRERADHTLQPTALVHEAYLRLIGGKELGCSNRRHFFQSAAEAMRRILIEHARRRNRQKRGGGRRPVPLDAVELAVQGDAEKLFALDDAIRRLGIVDDRAAEIVRLRFFAGFDVAETAELLAVSPRTVKREWMFARAWLYGVLREDDTGN